MKVYNMKYLRSFLLISFLTLTLTANCCSNSDCPKGQICQGKFADGPVSVNKCVIDPNQ